MGWAALRRIMSGQLRLWDEGPDGTENGYGAEEFRASIARELRYLLAISTEARRVGQLSPSGLAYSIGVALIEDFNMARGKGRSTDGDKSPTMPRFVDVKLTQEQKADFLRTQYTDRELVTFLQSVSDDGYRVGVSWNGESQSYTVSLTCRDPKSVNAGLCMTSFAGTVSKAIALAQYKHVLVTEEKWLGTAVSPEEDFG